jgi:hypothetical protein
VGCRGGGGVSAMLGKEVATKAFLSHGTFHFQCSLNAASRIFAWPPESASPLRPCVLAGEHALAANTLQSRYTVGDR